MSKIDTLAKKYKIHFIKGKRYYEYDMTTPLPLLEDTVPYLFKYKDIEICCSSWNKMTVEILSAIDKISPKTEEELLAISYDWTRAVVFSKTPKTNYSKYRNLYLHTNHTSTHSMMNIQGLLTAYGIPLSDCFMLIKRHFVAEPEDVKEAIREDTIENFSAMLKYKGKSVKDISTVITNFEVINKYLARVSPGYNDFFLFDDYSYFVNYRIKVFEYLEDEKHYSSADRKYRIISNCLWYLDDYYRNKSFWDSNAKNPSPRAAIEISPD